MEYIARRHDTRDKLKRARGCSYYIDIIRVDKIGMGCNSIWMTVAGEQILNLRSLLKETDARLIYENDIGSPNSRLRSTRAANRLDNSVMTNRVLYQWHSDRVGATDIPQLLRGPLKKEPTLAVDK